MPNQRLDEYDKKAQEILRDNPGNIRPLLKQFIQDQALKKNKPMRNLDEFLMRLGVNIDNITEFTEYKMVKTIITEEIEKI